MPDLLPNWTAGNEICTIFVDTLKTARTKEEINMMLTKFKSEASAYGFDLDVWGLRKSFNASMDKDYAHRKWKEGAREMLNKLIKDYPKQLAFLKEKEIVSPQFEP